MLGGPGANALEWKPLPAPQDIGRNAKRKAQGWQEVALGGFFLLIGSIVVLLLGVGDVWLLVLGGIIPLALGGLVLMFGVIHLTTPASAKQQARGSFEGKAIGAIFCAFLLPPLGLLLAVMSLRSIQTDPTRRGRGLAIASLVVSLVSLSWFVFYTLPNLVRKA
jgi:hypothetical protein